MQDLVPSCDFEKIAEYIALDKGNTTSAFIKDVFDTVDKPEKSPQDKGVSRLVLFFDFN